MKPLRTGPHFTRDRNRSDVADSLELEEAQKQAVRESVEYLHGPETVGYEKDELIVLCQARNSRHYVKAFVEHYTSLGAKHLVFLDNGSTDGTVEVLKTYDNVTVLRTELPYKTYNVAMKQYLIERFGKGRWSLLVDVDELFDYPYSDVVSLKALLRYLNEHSYTAVVAHMLDMFPEESIVESTGDGGVPLKELNKFYDLSNVKTYDYGSEDITGNVVSNEEVEILQGGIQKTLFDIRPPLTKHPLIFLDEEIKPVDLSEHWASSARVADFTGVLFHYKLLGNLYGIVQRETEEQTYVNRHGKYEKFRKVLESSPELSIKRETARKLESVNDLVGTPFAVVSEEYMRFVENKAQRSIPFSNSELGVMVEPFFRAKAEAAAQRRNTEQLGQLLRENLGGSSPAAKKLKERNESLRELNSTRVQKIRELNDKIRNSRSQSDNSASLKKRNRELEEQIQAIQSSTSWKLFTMLGQAKSKILRLGRK